MQACNLEPYKLVRKVIKDYGSYVLYQVYGIRDDDKEMVPLYKECEGK